jgi:hypothetical protein
MLRIADGVLSVTSRAVTLAVLALTLAVTLAASSIAAQRHRHPPARIGGKVHPAWPRTSGHVPRSGLARWLARQVGPTQVRPCRRRVKGRSVRCHRAKPPRRSVILPGSSADMEALARRAPDTAIATAAATPTGSTTLQLVRSFDIPTDDPSYVRLLNWSWTYDSAMSAAAFVVSGYSAQAEQLLDQLAALQHTDGSIEIAFNVAAGTAEPVFRSGTIASVGLAASLYDQSLRSNRYLAMEQRAAAYLLSLQGTNGLVRGGPDIGWYSTQHNLLAYSFLVLLGNELTSDGNHTAAATYYAAAGRIAAAIESSLLVHSGSTAYFIEGVGDNVQSLDADALGALYLESRGEITLAQQVLSYAQTAFAVSGRSIAHSSNAATYNMTYAAKGSFSGFMPYLGAGAPSVLWTEGSAEMLLAQASLGRPIAPLTGSLDAIAAVTPATAPLQADQTVTSPAYGAEYHVWPAAAAGAWMMLAQHTAPLFSRAG